MTTVLTTCFHRGTLIVAGLAALVAWHAVAAAGDELLVNGNFENGAKAPWTGGLIVGDSSSAYGPNHTTTFISGTYCAILQMNRAMTQEVVTVDSPCYATLSWKCKRRCNDTNNKTPMHYTVSIDGNVVWGEEELVDTVGCIWYRKVDNIRLNPGTHTLVFQGRVESGKDATVFLDDISLRDMGSMWTELLVNGGFEVSTNKADKVGRILLGWTGGVSGNSSSPYQPNHTTTFISQSWCGIVQKSAKLTQVFTNNTTYVATLSWKCKHRCDYNSTIPMYYTVLIDGDVIYGEEKLTGTTVYNRSVEGIKLRSGEHTLVFQGRTDNDQDQAFFLDDVSLRVTNKIPGLTIIVR